LEVSNLLTILSIYVCLTKIFITMSYFNHAFQKLFVGTDGFQTTAAVTTTSLSIGEFSFFDPKTWLSPADLTGTTTVACPLVLVSGSIHANDKIGPYHGGYAETVKSKTINPKYVSAFYKVEECDPQQAQTTVGLNDSFFITLAAGSGSGTTITVTDTQTLEPGMTLAVTAGTGAFATGGATVINVLSATEFTVAVIPTTGLSGATIVATKNATNCNKEFICGETYNLRVDIKGSPVLRTLTRNSYYTATAYTGCCPEGELAPTAVNPLIVYVNWAYQLLNSPLVNPFIQVEVTYNTLGDDVLWLELGDGTSSQANLDLLLGYIQNPSTLPGTSATKAGIIINGAYVDTRFENCTFYPNDSIIAYLEPVQIYASEVDLNGDPCAFQGLCVNRTCEAVQMAGSGENVIRSLILTEGYMQQPFYTGNDLRIREITNGDDVYNAINRNSLYTRYYIQHNVPRFNNPSSTFDNDQYLLEIVTSGDEATFEAFVTAWLENAGAGCTTLTTYACPLTCTPVSPTND